MIQRSLKRLSIFIVITVFLVACASLPKTPQGRYFAALKTFNDSVEDYLSYYDTVDKATQAEWKAEIDPKIKDVCVALDAWGIVLASPDDSQSKEDAYLKVRRELTFLLIKYGILEVK